MTTLHELIYYCNEPEPVGALMLTGEWGCGKTYLLEHSLKEELAATHIILRISLFGVASIEAIEKSVHSAWVDAYLEDKGWDSKSETLIKLQGKLKRLPLPDEWKNVISFNPSTLLNVESKLNGKNVVLVFDDLERSKLDTIDVLGCINDYCENQRFHTIVVANEEKIHDKEKENMPEKEATGDADREYNQVNVALRYLYQHSSVEISYDEIKEKIIERTIKYKPDYASIVHAVIAAQSCMPEEYYKFLVECEKNILRLFELTSSESANESEDIFSDPKQSINRPHNIRSLKCALQDFHRVYDVLIEQKFSELDKWLYSFVSYMLAYKAGKAKEGKYGTLFTYEEVRKMYPAFNNRFIFKSVKNWILKGEWDEQLLKIEIKEIRDREKAVEPKDMVRTNRIMDLDEDIIVQGFSEVVEMAYGGVLSLNEYVHFILNCYWAREYHIDLPCVIVWAEVKEGVQLCIKTLIEQNAKDQISRSCIDRKDKELFVQEEWETYELIEEFWNNNVLIFAQNRKLYLDTIRQNASQAFMECENKRMDVFDEEMADATAEAFLKCPNFEKRQFSGFFKSMWQSIKNRPDVKVKETVQGFEKLSSLLEKGKQLFQQENKMIAAKHTDVYITIINSLIEENAQDK